ncbi:MAG: L,D-transpeptidase [Cyanobacteria bacterium P01_H01_bin.162]
MNQRTGRQTMARLWRTAGLVALLLIGLTLPVWANGQTGNVVTDAVRLELDYTPERSLPADNNVYGLGRRSDHLPAAIPQADRVVLRLGDRRVYVYDGERILDHYPVAIGTPETPTPIGQFAVTQMVVNPVWQSPWTGEVFAPGANSALGLRWIGFTSLPNGDIGFHGTPTISSIGQAASNGCVRLTNEDVLSLYSHVKMGMTVVVEP